MENIAFNEQFVTLDNLKERGLSYYKINKLVNEGTLSKINRFTYEYMKYTGDYKDFYYAYAYIPDGVICEFSAASYYNLTNYMPHAIDVAVNRKKKIVTLPKWPTIELRYYSNERLNTGVIEVDENGNKFRIFDIEKTVIDILSFRNKLPIEEVIEVLKNYVRRKDRDLNKLYRYSVQFHCDKILRTYMEAIL